MELKFRQDPTTPCATIDPDLWFELNPRKAKRLCGGCDHTVACLNYSIKERIPYGVFGGLDEDERRRMSGHRIRTSRLDPGCSIDGCDDNHRANGFCKRHDEQVRYARRRRLNNGCSIEGCENDHKGLGLCNNHLQNLRRAEKRMAKR